MDLHDLADGVIAAHGRDEPPFGLYVLPSWHPGAELGRVIERDVFLATFGNTPELLAEEYGPYERFSVFFCVLDHRRRAPAGMMRVIVPSEAGHKSLHDLERVWGQDVDGVMARSGIDLDRSSLWDVATIAVAPEYRGDATNGLLSLAMFQTLAMLADREDLKWAIAVLDLIVLDLVQTRIGRPFKLLAGVEPLSYLDSPSSLPVVIDAEEYKARLRFTAPDLHELLLQGRGLEAAVSTPRWDLGITQAEEDEDDAEAG